MQLAEYLFARLYQTGVRDVLGVPGDFNLTLLDYVVPAGLTWVGNCNELNAAYAADAYGRVRGLSAMMVTFGVGELSAINGIAGAFSERAPIVWMVGAPSLAIQSSGKNMHHTFVDGEYQRFRKMAAEVTAFQVVLDDGATAAEGIDTAIQQCLHHSRPVYVQIPTDSVTLEVDAQRLKTPIPPYVFPAPPTMSPTEAAREINERIYAAKKPLIYVDGETRSLGVTVEVNEFVHGAHLPTFSSGFAKGLIEESVDNFYGFYSGDIGRKDYSEHWKASDLILTFGGHYSFTNSYGYRAIPDASKTIAFSHHGITIPALGDKPALQLDNIPIKAVLREMVDNFESTRLSGASVTATIEPKRVRPVEVPADLSGPITQEGFYGLINPLLRPGDVVMGETGTPSWGARELAFPPGCTYFGATTWLSIGYMLPAALGAALARRSSRRAYAADLARHGPRAIDGAHETAGGRLNDRCVLFMGDGSLQMTVQELATVIHQRLNVLVFVINNGGYTIERCLHGWRAPYNDIPPWRYAEAVSFFGAPDGPERRQAWTVRTFRDLQAVLESPRFRDAAGLRLVEVCMDPEDAPETLMQLTSRPPPKHAPPNGVTTG